ncbi:MAG: hypothetical protein HY912_14965 [Desulfomonile tiedjei]|uniref:Lipoprotein n=1 Tax=Desulfomonile tiedjei TaxID=2358 RepID=A0A9D6V2B8_9BACT|nr:hypothetical protein [Desulfomonile tiedjei]
MKLFPSLVAAALALVVAYGCVPGLKSSKNPPGVRDLKAQGVPDQSNSVPPPSPAQRPNVSPDGNPPSARAEKTVESSMDFRLKDEINRSAMEFAEKNVPNVKHIKTCYSQIYGGWYLILYVQKGKRTSLEQYLWNKDFQQWEVIYQLKELPAKQLEFHLKGEVGDEKCFVLK